MKKNTSIYVLIIVLVLLNVSSIYIFVFHDRVKHSFHEDHRKPRYKGKHQESEHPDRHTHFLEERLKFDKKQIKAFRNLRKEHFKKTRSITKSLIQDREFLFDHIKDADFEKDSIITIMVKKQAAIESEKFDHFRAIRNLCSEDQIDKFDELLGRLSKRMIHGRHERRGGNYDH